MKIFHTADLHLGTFPGPEFQGENVRFLNMQTYLKNLVDRACLEKPDLIVIAGDLFHQAKVWSDRGLREQSVMVKFIRNMLDIAYVFILRGTPNHDSQEQFATLQNTFQDDERLTIAVKTGVSTLHINGETVNIVALPGFTQSLFDESMPNDVMEGEFYTRKINDRMVELVNSIGIDGYKVIVGHYTITGCSMESGQIAFFSNSEPVIDSNKLNVLDFDLGCFGHIHKPQQIGNKSFYSGAIARLNFNDEGQSRGYYTHELTKVNSVVNLKSEFHETKGWDFMTMILDDQQISDINDGILDLSLNQNVKDKIVRVQYSCTDVNNKAFSPAIVEKQLYKAGAFYVYEISPIDIKTSVTAHSMTGENTPSDNLIEYLSGKDGLSANDIGRICTLAQPLFDESVAVDGHSHLTGLFVPVEICVHNYRNYVDAHFDYNTVQFCTINGENGVGKSSLFMDAVVDALYESPREGDLTGWIRNDPSVKSGSIQFTFKLGDDTFRVSRSRRKSGSPSLKFEQFVDGVWLDISKAKIKDTQQIIEDVIGMDVTTFKSCALIMQDQYGLFLSADKESRMDILGNLLGLGVYDTLESLVSEHLSSNNKDIKFKQQEQAVITEKIPDMFELEQRMNQLVVSKAKADSDLNIHQASLSRIQAQLELCKDAQIRADKISSQIRDIQVRQADLNLQLDSNSKIVKQADIQLGMAVVINEGVNRYNALLVQEKELLVKRTQFESLKEQEKSLQGFYNKAHSDWNLNNNKLVQLDNDIKVLDEELKHIDEFKVYFDESLQLDIEWNKHVVIHAREKELRQQIDLLLKSKSDVENQFNVQIAQIESKIANDLELVKALENNNCIDIEKATCRFLIGAKSAQQELPILYTQKEQVVAKYNADIANLDAQIQQLNSNIVGESERKLFEIPKRKKEIEPMVQKYNSKDTKCQQISYMKSQVVEMQKLVQTCYESMEHYRTQITAIKEQLVGYIDVEKQYESIIKQLNVEKHWVDEKSALPTWEVKKQNAQNSLQVLSVEMNRLQAQFLDLNSELQQEQLKTQNRSHLDIEFKNAQMAYNSVNVELQKILQDIGVCEKMKEDLVQAKAEVDKLQNEINRLAQISADYELLKQAFSTDGIRHNIIRNIIPNFEATASAILSQMSGGKMRVEFVTEKTLKSNKKKEVTTLDIIINDSITGKLPYMSRSGGERVKAALSVILALAEIKSTRAGIQLGFLGIDEPPYLDATGAQAYCDALFAIQARYPMMKIMAITHDPSMKGRFPQDVEVVKTDKGSKIVQRR